MRHCSTGFYGVYAAVYAIATIAEEFAQVGIHEVKSDLVEQAGQALWNLVATQSRAFHE